MRHARSGTIARVCIICTVASTASAFDDGAASSITDARKHIQSGQYASAVNLLEDALVTTPRNQKPVILDLLRQSYTALAKEADAAGRARDAAHYRENLEILAKAQPSSSAPPKSPAAPEVTAQPQPAEPAVTKPPTMPRSETLPSTNAAATPLPAPTPLAEPSALPPPALVDNAKDPSATQPAPHPAKSKTTPPVALLPRTGKNALDKPAAPAPDPEITKGDAVSTKEPSPTNAEPLTTAEADRLFVARQYEAAGSRYAALAEQNALPSDRNPHWAYCRKVAVVRKINAHPRTAHEWDEIQKEIQDIQVLMPNNWFGEYLKNYVAEARRTNRLPTAPAEGVIVRGSAPEEPPARSSRLSKLLKRAKGDPAPDPTAANPKAKPIVRPRVGEQPLELPAEGSLKSGSIDPPPAPQEPAASPPGELLAVPDAKQGEETTPHPESLSAALGPASTRPVLGVDVPVDSVTPPLKDSQVVRAAINDGPTTSSSPAAATREPRFQVYETPNFRIYHTNIELAQKAGEVAEQVRARQSERWSSPAARSTWTPRCDFYLYTDGKHLAHKTGQAETSPGFSTMGTSGNKVTTRLIHLRADHPDLLAAVLPHEVTHVVMADLFVLQQIPRWADEGIAVLAEPAETQRLRAADLKEPLEMGGLIALDKLMTMDYPAPQHLNLYYAQSISLTRFLVAQGPPDQFVKFVRHTQRSGLEPALRDVYQIDGLAALQDRWLAYAKEQVLPRTASASANGLPAAGDQASR